jgi:hypothetical protein
MAAPSPIKEGDMSHHPASHNRYISNGLHPRIYSIMVALAIWFILWAWIGFADASGIDYLLAVMTAFFIVAVSLQALAGRQWHYHHIWAPKAAQDFDDWIHGDFDTGSGRIPAREAFIEVLLPLAAAAFSMMGFAIVTLIVGG